MQPLMTIIPHDGSIAAGPKLYLKYATIASMIKPM